MKKSKRCSNFTKEEEILLLEEIEKRKHIVECKTTDKINNTQKNTAWNLITAAFNAKVNMEARTVDQLKSKYENLKTKARKCAAEEKHHIKGTGGGPLLKTEKDPTVEAVLRVTNEKTVFGMENTYDSDTVCLSHDNMNNTTCNEAWEDTPNLINTDIKEEIIMLLNDEQENEPLTTIENIDTIITSKSSLSQNPANSKSSLQATQEKVINCKIT